MESQPEAGMSADGSNGCENKVGLNVNTSASGTETKTSVANGKDKDGDEARADIGGSDNSLPCLPQGNDLNISRSKTNRPETSTVEQSPGDRSAHQVRQLQQDHLQQNKDFQQNSRISQSRADDSLPLTCFIPVANPVSSLEFQHNLIIQNLRYCYAQALMASQAFAHQHAPNPLRPAVAIGGISTPVRRQHQELTGPVREVMQAPPRNKSDIAYLLKPQVPQEPQRHVSPEAADSKKTSSNKRNGNLQDEDKELKSGSKLWAVKKKHRTKTRITAGVLIPCRARGMAEDHNVETAVIQIPRNAKHGDYLFCSHKVCQLQGSKFRYCAQCKLPAARRSFRKRHQHGESAPDVVDNHKTSLSDPGSEDDGDDSVESFDIAHMDLKCFSQRNSAGDDRKIAMPKPRVKRTTTLNGPSVVTSSTGAGAYALPRRIASQYPDSSEEARRRVLWNVLLDTRPDRRDEGAMKTWLDEVVDVSERGVSLLFASERNNQASACDGDE